MNNDAFIFLYLHGFVFGGSFRVTLANWLIEVFAQNFGDVMGIYEGHLPLSEGRWGGDSSWRWWGHPTTI